ncbi:ABC transporter permease [Chitinophaga pendula]|uniref:ABC transporter permease n=1 Tax=Chitinophaga TaxID=79328 RepID=UPI000BB0B316|nr:MULTISPECIES: ABC transporter permease [Chitinophaga]ASZ10141.1 hypothetical protein CK934_03675 [Chitinophaga sp. MD30]UCJ06905.1 ABC transporter permease [Chitinophaga pendula]
MIGKIALSNLRYRPLPAISSWLLISCSTGMLALLLLLQQQTGKQLEENAAGVDMVLGAKGSPLQLVLSAVYQADAPTGNISLDSASKWMHHPFVKTAIPLAMGDNYKGFRIVGSNTQYIRHFDGQLQSGRLFAKPMEAVIGSNVAQRTHLHPDDHFAGSHGLAGEGEEHTEHPYQVTGVLQPTGTLLDQLIITSISSVWHIHAAHDHHHAHKEETADVPASDDRQITAVLLQYNTPLAQLQLPRIINSQTAMQAAVPAIEINRLLSLMGIGIDTLRLFAWLLMGLGACSLFLLLFQSIQQRRYELALLRSMGASPVALLQLVLTEASLLAVAGILSGYLLSRLALLALQPVLQHKWHYETSLLWQPASQELILALAAWLICLLAAVIPGMMAFRLNISKTLSHA